MSSSWVPRQPVGDELDDLVLRAAASTRSLSGYEIQPKLDWDKGKAVLHLLEAVDLDREEIVALS